MKRLLFLTVVFYFSENVYAQTCDNTLPVTENFDDETVLDVCWNVMDQDGDGNNWYWREYSSSQGGYKCLTSRSWSASKGNLTPDNWVYSYGIDLSSYSTDDPVIVTWNIRAESASFAHEYYTMYAATGNSISDFESSSVKVSEYADDVGASGVFVTRSLDISALAGNTIYIAFRHENLEGSQLLLNLDDVSISTSLLDVEELERKAFTHYYNVNNKELMLNSNGYPLKRINIFNAIGQQVFLQKLYNSKEAIKLTHLRKGIYIAQVHMDHFKKTFKFVKS